MKICVHGAGYVGLVTGACLADTGNDLVCFDIYGKEARFREDEATDEVSGHI